MKDIRETRCAS